ncbi:MAG TPA: DHH family phosphoesterase [Gemmatimonadota bacterium]|nr:DHH family phosphoesterase [Gemmatimonadota bacterium]
MSQSEGPAAETGGSGDHAGDTDAGPMEPAETTVDQAVRLSDLLGAVEDAAEVLVLTHDNPDPDAIASAAALAFLLGESAGVQTRLAFGGIVGRAENRALIGELDADFQRMSSLEIPSSTLVALVDTQPRTGNNSLPEGRIAAIVVDHHPVRPETAATTYSDVRPDYGASCSILVEYLRAAGLEPDRSLATALFYGIQSETMDLGREVSAADVEASLYLYPRSDPASISRIRHARVPATYLQSVHAALERARRFGGVLWVPMGRLDYPDLGAELADMFMRVEGVDWVVACGRYHDDLLFSVRTYEPGAHAGDLVRRVIGERGSAGGHGMLAGAQIPLRALSDGEVDELLDSLLEDFRAELRVSGEEGRAIIGTSEAGAGGEAG